jgi:hypothetical protein
MHGLVRAATLDKGKQQQQGKDWASHPVLQGVSITLNVISDIQAR